MDLYLVRHAIAYEHDSERWPDDAQRPLTAQGKKRFRRAARGLATLVKQVDTMLTSPFVRARETADLLHEDTGWPAPVECVELTSEQPTQAIISLLGQAYPDAKSVALVGHEPHLHELASHLLAGDPSAIQLEMKKGGVACLRFAEDVQPGAATLRWLATPGLLRKLA